MIVLHSKISKQAEISNMKIHICHPQFIGRGSARGPVGCNPYDGWMARVGQGFQGIGEAGARGQGMDWAWHIPHIPFLGKHTPIKLR